MEPPAVPARRRGRTRLVALLVAVLVALSAWYVLTHRTRTITGQAFGFVNPPYSPQPERNAEWTGNRTGALTGAQIDNLGAHVGYEIIPKFADNFDLRKHFVEARELVAAAKAHGNDLRVLEYYNATFFPLVNLAAWGRYAAGFQSSWYLQDADGAPIPYYGAGKSASTGAPPVGYVVDLTNPDYRAWVVKLVSSWMRAAPYAGVAFDSANPLVGYQSRTPFADGTQTFSDLLCGGTSPLDVAGNCPRVSAWNAGLVSLVAEVRTALRPMGGEVLYNGISPGGQRPDRNLSLLDSADLAANEGFCYLASPSDPQRLNFTSLSDDASIMQTSAQQGKKVIEITNFDHADHKRYGAYCLAGFLMGWQPGYDYWVYHQNYVRDTTTMAPTLAEQDLVLGNPLSKDYQMRGNVLTRQFQNGMAAVNTGDAPAATTVSAAMVAFADGAPTARYAAGARITLAPRSGLLLLSRAYLYGTSGR